MTDEPLVLALDQGTTSSRAIAFDRRGWGRSLADPATGPQPGSVAGDLDALLPECDIVTLHTPLNDATRGLISRKRLALLPDGATLVNTARGAVVDEDALVDELESGRISAGLDVFVHEPHVPERLFGLPNVVLTPHIASASVATRRAMAELAADNLIAALTGGAPPTPVNPEVLARR